MLNDLTDNLLRRGSQLATTVTNVVTRDNNENGNTDSILLNRYSLGVRYTPPKDAYTTAGYAIKSGELLKQAFNGTYNLIVVIATDSFLRFHLYLSIIQFKRNLGK